MTHNDKSLLVVELVLHSQSLALFRRSVPLWPGLLKCSILLPPMRMKICLQIFHRLADQHQTCRMIWTVFLDHQSSSQTSKYDKRVCRECRRMRNEDSTVFSVLSNYLHFFYFSEFWFTQNHVGQEFPKTLYMERRLGRCRISEIDHAYYCRTPLEPGVQDSTSPSVTRRFLPTY